MRSCPVTVSMPTAAKAKPSIMEATTLATGSLLMPTKLQKVSNCTAKYSAGPKCNANFARTGAKKVINTTAKSAPTKDEVKAAVRACAARPCCAIG